MKKALTSIYYSFPIQLLILHLRSNLLLLAIWMVLALFVTGDLALKFGLRYLFLTPEYLNEVGFWSFFFLGLGFGAFVMSWNLTTYLLGANNFPFLASLARPFTKFCLNNVVLPFIFLCIYLVNLVHFELWNELSTPLHVAGHIGAFLAGMLLLIGVLAAYFSFTNKDILSYVRYRDNLPPNIRKGGPGRRGLPDFEAIRTNKNQWRVDTYWTELFQPRLVRSVAHYDRSILMRVFKQNHTNALILQLISFVILVLLGIMMDKPSFRIPTGANIFLLSSIVVALTGAVSYWFDKWRIVVLILLIIFNISYQIAFIY